MLRAGQALSAERRGSAGGSLGVQEGTTGRSLLQNGSSSGGGNASYADFEAVDTVNSDLTKEGQCSASQAGLHVADHIHLDDSLDSEACHWNRLNEEEKARPSTLHQSCQQTYLHVLHTLNSYT